jgi:hypothetical protein
MTFDPTICNCNPTVAMSMFSLLPDHTIVLTKDASQPDQWLSPTQVFATITAVDKYSQSSVANIWLEVEWVPAPLFFNFTMLPSQPLVRSSVELGSPLAWNMTSAVVDYDGDRTFAFEIVSSNVTRAYNISTDTGVLSAASYSARAGPVSLVIGVTGYSPDGSSAYAEVTIVTLFLTISFHPRRRPLRLRPHHQVAV